RPICKVINCSSLVSQSRTLQKCGMYKNKQLKTIYLRHLTKDFLIENHLFKAFDQGLPIAWEIFFNDEEEKEVLHVYENFDEKKLKPMKEALPDTFTYTKIKAVLAKNKLL